MREKSKKIDGVSVGLVALGLAFGATACNIDNQSLAKGALWDRVNPAPTATDFAVQNAGHKVLMAVIDSGVDYNHPTLRKNIHFQLGNDGTPVGAGRDLVADDGWPYPTVARTAMIDPSVSAEDKDKALKNALAIGRMLALEPSLRPYLSMDRVPWQEVGGGTYHGTHVSGLMTYDRPDFGLMAYRVLPSVERNKPDFDYTTESFQMITDAINQAAADGARVVNMSLGLDFTRAVQGDESKASIESVDKLLKLSKMVEDAIKSHPDVLFVSAAGNDGAWKDSFERLGMPCGIKAPNALCVGALRDNGEPAPFTDIPIGGVDLVFALGHRVYSTIPTEMCNSQAMLDTYMFDLDTPTASLQTTADKLKKECFETPGFAYLSGTSMATPLVSHVAGEILAKNPALDGAGVIREIYRRAMPDFIGIIPVYKLKIAKPSWNKPYIPKSAVEEQELAASGESESYFTAIVPTEKAVRK